MTKICKNNNDNFEHHWGFTILNILKIYYLQYLQPIRSKKKRINPGIHFWYHLSLNLIWILYKLINRYIKFKTKKLFCDLNISMHLFIIYTIIMKFITIHFHCVIITVYFSKDIVLNKTVGPMRKKTITPYVAVKLLNQHSMCQKTGSSVICKTV